ncbi:MAG: aldehyde dehydrogenase family protein [Pseudomonadota bacterium]
MRDYTQFYIDGEWRKPDGAKTLDVINPATEEVAGKISLGGEEHVDAAVKAARNAFPGWSETPLEDRISAVQKVAEIYGRRMSDIAAAVTEEMGAPEWLAQRAQAPAGLGHLMTAIDAAKAVEWIDERGSTAVVKEPIGVCGFITPWNWPMNQLTAKFAPAVLCGCTIVHKPSEIAPFSAHIFAEICDEAGLPAGVYNLVDGEGPAVGAAIAAHPGVDMVSFTGSTRAGVDVAEKAAPTVKRVHQELGGKSPTVILDDADLPAAVGDAVGAVMMNSGQSCVAPARLIAPRSKLEEIEKIAAEAAAGWAPGEKTGPLVSETQWKKVQHYIDMGGEEGARLIAGGPGKPEGFETGYFAKPTVFSDVKNDMTIAREEIFGPVVTIIGYDDEEEAIAIANDTEYGLSARVYGGDLDRARRVASKIRAGYVHINAAPMDLKAPFGGYKKSGNGREFGVDAFDEFLETKSILGYKKSA